jgi:hypothetical protein
VPHLLPTSVLAVSWAHFGFPEQQATSHTRPVNSQGAPLSGVVPALCCSACVGCLWWIPTQKDAKTQFLAPWHPTVAATNNLMTVLYFSSEMSGLWPGPRSQKIRWKLAAAPAVRGAHTHTCDTRHGRWPWAVADRGTEGKRAVQLLAPDLPAGVPVVVNGLVGQPFPRPADGALDARYRAVVVL